MGEKDDELGLGLSLRLGWGGETRPFEPSLQLGKLDHMRRPSQQHPMHTLNPRQRITSWNELSFHSSVTTNRNNCPAETRSFLGISVNRTPVVVVDADQEDQQNGTVSSPNSTVSSISGKRCEREAAAGGCGEETEVERASCSRGSDDDDGGGGGDGDGDEAARKKLRLSKDQALVLEETFKEHNTLNPKEKLALAKQLNLRPRQVEVWFQNRRARTKLKQTEVDCEYLKRCCENLTHENRRLQKEVHELRALKLSPQLYMHMNPPTTLTMCPQCERVSSTSSSSSSPPADAAVAAAAASTPALAKSNLRHPLPINLWATTPIQR